MKIQMGLLVSGALLTALGCTSIESTMVTRDETNQTWEQHRCLNGIPITLKVPTHLKVYIFNKHFLEVVQVGDSTEVQPVDMDIPIRDFAQEFLYTEKIFVVDFKRPAAGSSNLRLDMTDEQYFKQIQHDITDETIGQVQGLLGSLLPGGRFATLASGGAGAPDAKPVRSLVAVGIFEIDAPDFEQKVMEFVNCHINKSHDAWVVPPGVGAINRVGIGDNTAVPHPHVPFCPDVECWDSSATLGSSIVTEPQSIQAHHLDASRP